MLLVACLAACSSSSTGTAGGGDSGTPLPDGAVPPADGPFACGTSTCTATQYCVQPCDCGGEQACNPLGDAGACPTGQQLQGNCCIQPCTNPPPSCQDVNSCGGFGGASRNVQCPCPG